MQAAIKSKWIQNAANVCLIPSWILRVECTNVSHMCYLKLMSNMSELSEAAVKTLPPEKLSRHSVFISFTPANTCSLNDQSGFGCYWTLVINGQQNQERGSFCMIELKMCDVAFRGRLMSLICGCRQRCTWVLQDNRWSQPFNLFIPQHLCGCC